MGNTTTEGEAYFQTFRTAMGDLGYVEGSNLVLDVRYTDPELVALPALVDEMIALKPDVLLGWESVAQVMRAKTTSIPIVLVGGSIRSRPGSRRASGGPG